MIIFLHCNQRLFLLLNYIDKGEYFQFNQILIKHWGKSNKTQTKKTKSAGRKVKVINFGSVRQREVKGFLPIETLPPIITQMFEFKFFLPQKLSPQKWTQYLELITWWSMKVTSYPMTRECRHWLELAPLLFFAILLQWEILVPFIFVWPFITTWIASPIPAYGRPGPHASRPFTEINWRVK